MVRGEPEAKYPNAWSWILLVLLINSFSKDDKAAIVWPHEFGESILALRRLGLLPASSIKEVALASSKNSFKVKLPLNFEFAFENNPINEVDLQFLHLVRFLKETVRKFRSRSRHLVIIDGLDDILSDREIQFQSLAALVTEVSRLNQFFREKQVPGKILILCRTDLFERLPGPNKNKLRQDSAIDFNWYSDPRKPFNSDLVKLANLRASLTYKSLGNLFTAFFPAEVDGLNIYAYLLNNTRHTPRDFLQLLKHIQKYSSDVRLDAEEVKSGIRDYSIYYFLPEIKDELVGYVSEDIVEKVFTLLSVLRKRDFTLAEIESIASSRRDYKDIELERIFEVLYECSAIGHIERGSAGNNRFTFKYRTRHSSFSAFDRIFIHRGIWKAMNM
ncbi:MAG: hypothetical protein HC899_37895 [Leptolyngbyaceae cyanobacterium SM1_4_3]|nr:hypothetical protein [Leptolyngbyaceae cyanobacterium SM1_4_3]